MSISKFASVSITKSLDTASPYYEISYCFRMKRSVNVQSEMLFICGFSRVFNARYELSL